MMLKQSLEYIVPFSTRVREHIFSDRTSHILNIYKILNIDCFSIIDHVGSCSLRTFAQHFPTLIFFLS